MGLEGIAFEREGLFVTQESLIVFTLFKVLCSLFIPTGGFFGNAIPGFRCVIFFVIDCILVAAAMGVLVLFSKRASEVKGTQRLARNGGRCCH